MYTGKELDRDTDFYYYGARYYQDDFMHFLQPDPLIQNIYEPADLNRYSYVRNNPYKYTDPTGNSALLVGLHGYAVVGAILVGGFGIVVSRSDSGKYDLGFYAERGVGGLFGGGTLGASIAGSYSPNAQDLTDLEGTSINIGASMGEAISGGVGTSFGTDKPITEQKPSSYSAEGGIGGRAPFPVEGTVTRTTTDTVSIKDLAGNVITNLKNSPDSSNINSNKNTVFRNIGVSSSNQNTYSTQTTNTNRVNRQGGGSTIRNIFNRIFTSRDRRR